MSDRIEDPVHSSSAAPDSADAGRDPPLYRRLVASRLPCLRCAVSSFLAALTALAGIGATGVPPAESAGSPTVREARTSTSDPSTSTSTSTSTSASPERSDDSTERPPTERDVDSDHPLLGVDPELLNAERRILQLLIVEGGRLPQSGLAEQTRWSESTISRTLCRMETQGRIERRRVGSGKYVFLPQDEE